MPGTMGNLIADRLSMTGTVRLDWTTPATGFTPDMHHCTKLVRMISANAFFGTWVPGTGCKEHPVGTHPSGPETPVY